MLTTFRASQSGKCPRALLPGVALARGSNAGRGARGAGARSRASRGAGALCSLFQHNMPFWRISCHADLEALRHALELEYL